MLINVTVLSHKRMFNMRALSAWKTEPSALWQQNFQWLELRKQFIVQYGTHCWAWWLFTAGCLGTHLLTYTHLEHSVKKGPAVGRTEPGSELVPVHWFGNQHITGSATKSPSRGDWTLPHQIRGWDPQIARFWQSAQEGWFDNSLSYKNSCCSIYRHCRF